MYDIKICLYKEFRILYIYIYDISRLRVNYPNFDAILSELVISSLALGLLTRYEIYPHLVVAEALLGGLE
jgi:hypothetical protein